MYLCILQLRIYKNIRMLSLIFYMKMSHSMDIVSLVNIQFLDKVT